LYGCIEIHLSAARRPPLAALRYPPPVLSDAIDDFLAGQRIGPSHLLVACSGGIDSTALLVALGDLRERGFRVTCAHVNHHLRGEESDEDEDFLKRLCAELHVPLAIADGTCEPQAIRHRGLESAAREVRQEALKKLGARVGADFIVTAHQLNDQAETVLMRLVTGSGIERLRGIAPRTDDGFLRPLLSLSRTEIEAFLAERGLSGRRDSSNADRRFLRNRMRHELLPMLEACNPRIMQTLAETAEQTGAVIELLEPLIDAARQRAIRRSPDEAAFRVDAMPENRWLRNALLHREIRRLDPAAREISAADLRRLSDALATTTRISVTKELELVSRGAERILRRRLPVSQPFESPIEVGNTVQIPGQAIRVSLVRAQDAASGARGDPTRQLFQLPPGSDHGSFSVRNRRPGDRFRPLGLREEKKLNRFLIDRKIPKDDRERLPLLLWNGRIVWVAGVAVSDEFKVTDLPGDIYEVSWERK
jgi:tRNA(Ile)-lysidine synthase